LRTRRTKNIQPWVHQVSGTFPRIALSTLASIALSHAAQAQMGYPLVCRSGNSMQLSWSSLFNARTNFIAYYARAPIAAGTNNPLGLGQCAWVDRPLNAMEPLAMQWNLDATVGARFKAYGSSTPVVAITGGLDMARAKLFCRLCADQRLLLHSHCLQFQRRLHDCHGLSRRPLMMGHTIDRGCGVHGVTCCQTQWSAR
jgi:hypothetical protein